MKKIISCLLGTSILAASALGLAGCGGKEEASGNLKWVCLGEKLPGSDAVLEQFSAKVKEKIGMGVDIEYIEGAAFTEKTKLKMASGEPFDLAFTGYVNPYHTAVSLGGLYDITDLLDNIEFKDGTKAKMSDVIPQYVLDSAMVNERIYGIPNIQVMTNPQAIVMRKAVADECGVDLEGLEKMALANKDAASSKAFMDKFTEELAKIHAKRPDLFAVNPLNPAISNTYETIVTGISIKKDGSDPQLKLNYEIDELTYGIDKVHEWYEKGYIRNDIASKGNNPTNVDEEKQNAVFFSTWKPGADAIFNKKWGEETVWSCCCEPYFNKGGSLATMTSVGANTKHPEEAVQLLYLLNSDKELFNLLVWGIEGTHYTFNEDGTATSIQGAGYEDRPRDAWIYGNQFNSLVMEGQDPTVWEETQKMNDEAVKSPALGFVPDTEEIATELANLENVRGEFKAKVEFGTSPREEYWDEYIQKQKDAGIEKVRDVLQKQYDEFLANKK